MKEQEAFYHSQPDRREGTLPEVQMAFRFTPLPISALNLDRISIDTRLLQLPFSLPILRKFASHFPLVTLDTQAPVPQDETTKEYGFNVYSVGGCGIDGSDRALAKLKYSLSNLSYLAETTETSSVLQVQRSLFKAIANLSPAFPSLSAFHNKGRRLSSFTLGHEILLDGNAVYPLLDDRAVGNERCVHCRQGRENHCTRFGQSGPDQGPIRGFALGYGGFIVDEQGQVLTELGGGMSEKIAVSESQLYPHELSLKRAAYIDTYACVLESLHGIVGKNQPIDPEKNPDIPVMIIGFGPVGLTAADVLKQQGMNMEKVTIVTKHRIQQEVAEDYGAKTVNAQDPNYINKLAAHLDARIVHHGKNIWVDGGTPLIIDAVGTKQSVELSSYFIRDGYAVLVGLPQDIHVDLNRFSMRGGNPHLTWWAPRTFFAQAIDALQQSPFDGWEEITKAHRLEDSQNAYFPSQEEKTSYIKHVVVAKENKTASYSSQ